MVARCAPSYQVGNINMRIKIPCFVNVFFSPSSISWVMGRVPFSHGSTPSHPVMVPTTTRIVQAMVTGDLQ